jgi:hypothetical protein
LVEEVLYFISLIKNRRVSLQTNLDRQRFMLLSERADFSALIPLMMRLLHYFLLTLLLAFGPLCSSLPSASATPSLPAGTRPNGKPAEERTLLVYPNPSTGIVHISINGFEGRKLELRVLNVIGSVIYKEAITELNDRFTKTLDLSKFASGLYYVRLEGDNASQMRKLLIR